MYRKPLQAQAEQLGNDQNGEYEELEQRWYDWVGRMYKRNAEDREGST